MRYPPAIKATNRTKEIYYIKSKAGKDMKRVKFTCGMCGRKDLKRSEMSLDHIIPVTDKSGFKDWNTFVDNLFCEEENLLLICQEPCHRLKTEKENEGRVEASPNFRKGKKKKIGPTS